MHAEQPADADDWQARLAVSGHELSGQVVGARPANRENRRRLLDGKEIGRRITVSALGHLDHLHRSLDSTTRRRECEPRTKSTSALEIATGSFGSRSASSVTIAVMSLVIEAMGN